MNSTAYENSIVLQIDEANRAITNDGKNTPIILGVKGDDCAERVYFESPRILSPEFDLLSTVEGEVEIHAYINYKNANNEPYIQECNDIVQVVGTDKVTFSWLVTNRATIAKGDVKFNVCIKKFTYSEEKGAMELTNEWHTTTFIGRVLDGIDVTAKTPEVITHDTVTLQALTMQMQNYAGEVEGYANEVKDLHTKLDNVDEYVDETVAGATGVKYLGAYELGDYLDELDNVIEPGVYLITLNEDGAPSDYKAILYVTRADDGFVYQDVTEYCGQVKPYYRSRGTVDTEATAWDEWVTDTPAYVSDLSTLFITETLFVGDRTKNSDQISASENVDTLMPGGCELSKVPKAGSKLKIYIHNTETSSYNYKSSFVIELNVIERNGTICGRGSQYIAMTDDVFVTYFEGVMTAGFVEGNSKKLSIGLITKYYNTSELSGPNGQMTCFYIDKVEMITGPGI